MYIFTYISLEIISRVKKILTELVNTSGKETSEESLNKERIELEVFALGHDIDTKEEEINSR